MIKYVIVVIFCIIKMTWSGYYQENTTYKIINSNQLIIGLDTLVIDKTRITDILKQDEIEGMEPFINVGEHGDDDDLGNGWVYYVDRGDCNLKFVGQKDDTYLLKIMRLTPSDYGTIYINDTICFDNISEKIMSDLDCYESHKISDSLFSYQRIGVWFKIYKSGSGMRLQSIRFHSKDFDEEIINYTYLKGKLYNKESDSLIAGILLSYTTTDTLRIFTRTYLKGKFHVQTNDVESIDIHRLGYESIRIDSLLDGKNNKDFYLKPKTYLTPELRVSKSGIIEIDSADYKSQFPRVRDSLKIKYFDWDGGYLDNDPIGLTIGRPKIGFSNFYKIFVEHLDLKKYSRKSEAYIWFSVNEKGKVSLTKITGDDALINDHVANAFLKVGDWSSFSMRGKTTPITFKLKFSIR